MLLREWLEAVLLEEVEHAHAVQLGHKTRMVAEVKVLCQVKALVRIARVVLLERLEYSDLDFARVAVLLDGPDDLDCNLLARLNVPCLDDLTERSLSQ